MNNLKDLEFSKAFLVYEQDKELKNQAIKTVSQMNVEDFARIPSMGPHSRQMFCLKLTKSIVEMLEDLFIEQNKSEFSKIRAILGATAYLAGLGFYPEHPERYRLSRQLYAELLGTYFAVITDPAEMGAMEENLLENFAKQKKEITDQSAVEYLFWSIFEEFCRKIEYGEKQSFLSIFLNGKKN